MNTNITKQPLRGKDTFKFNQTKISRDVFILPRPHTPQGHTTAGKVWQAKHTDRN